MNRKERRAAGERGPRDEATHPTVELAYVHPGDVSAAFMSSVIRCRDYELMRTHNLFAIRERRARSGSIAKSRNEVTTMFLRSKTDWLWFVDADMGFAREALHKLLAVADPVKKPLIGGLCFAHRTEGFDEETNAELFGHIPTLYLWNKDEDGNIKDFSQVLDYPRDTLCQVDTTGAACILIHRTVLEQMQEKYGNNWWTLIPHPTFGTFGEDTSFFIRADELGIPLHVHTGVRTSHDKGGIFLTEQTWEQQEILRAVLAADLADREKEAAQDESSDRQPRTAPAEEDSVTAG